MAQFKNKTVITRKPHSCWACCRKFPQGTPMNYTSGIFDNALYSSYYCETCEKIMSISQEQYREVFDDGIEQGWTLNCLQKGQTPEEYLKGIETLPPQTQPITK